MGKVSVLVFLVIFAVIAVFAFVNTELTTISVPFGEDYEIPKFALMLVSAFCGMVVMFLYFAIRDTKNFIDNWQYQKKQKRDIRVQELYSKALNSILARDDDAAKGFLEDILKEDPDHIDTLLRLGDIALDAEDYQAATSYYQKAKSLLPRKLETLFAIENLMEKTGRKSEALKYLEDILEIDSDNLAALYRKRDLLERQGSWDELVYLQKAIVKHSHHEKDKKRETLNLIGYEYEYGRHSLESNQLEKAKKAFKTVLRMDKDFTPALLGLVEVMLGERETEEAVNLLEREFDASSSKIVMARLEDLLISLGEPSRLIRIYKNNLLKNPADPALKFFLGKLFYRLEMIDDAFETLAGIDTGGKAYPELHHLMGNLYLRKRQPEKAAAEFAKAAELTSSLLVPYCCRECAFTAQDWSGRCPSCRQWNTYQFNLGGSCRV